MRIFVDVGDRVPDKSGEGENKCWELRCMWFCRSCMAWKSCSFDLWAGWFWLREKEREPGEPLGIVESIKVEMGWTAGCCIGPYWKVAREKYISTGWSGCSWKMDAQSARCVVLLSLAPCLEIVGMSREIGMRTWRVGKWPWFSCH